MNEPPNESNPWLPTVHDNLDDAMVEIDQLRAIVQQIDQQALSAMYHVDGGLTANRYLWRLPGCDATLGNTPSAAAEAAIKQEQQKTLQRKAAALDALERMNVSLRCWHNGWYVPLGQPKCAQQTPLDAIEVAVEWLKTQENEA